MTLSLADLVARRGRCELTGRHVNFEPHFVTPASMALVGAPLDSFGDEDILSLINTRYLPPTPQASQTCVTLVARLTPSILPSTPLPTCPYPSSLLPHPQTKAERSRLETARDRLDGDEATQPLFSSAPSTLRHPSHLDLPSGRSVCKSGLSEGNRHRVFVRQTNAQVGQKAGKQINRDGFWKQWKERLGGALRRSSALYCSQPMEGLVVRGKRTFAATALSSIPTRMWPTSLPASACGFRGTPLFV